MTKDEILEGNKLICEFLGYKILEKKYQTRHWCSSDESDWVIEEGEILCDQNGDEIDDENQEPYLFPEDVPFIFSWNWLMIVVDKICDYEEVGDFEIGNSYIQIIAAINIDEPISDILIDHSGGDDKKRAVFEACVKLIKQIK